eukprot:Hpha_TRINITY_DN12057_c0_g1::TRINITY_DN12057_c0_g1_i2::g.140926::m.140926
MLDSDNKDEAPLVLKRALSVDLIPPRPPSRLAVPPRDDMRKVSCLFCGAPVRDDVWADWDWDDGKAREEVNPRPAAALLASSSDSPLTTASVDIKMKGILRHRPRSATHPERPFREAPQAVQDVVRRRGLDTPRGLSPTASNSQSHPRDFLCSPSIATSPFLGHGQRRGRSACSAQAVVSFCGAAGSDSIRRQHTSLTDDWYSHGSEARSEQLQEEGLSAVEASVLAELPPETRIDFRELCDPWEEIGSGQFGAVWKCVYHTVRESVAVKCIKDLAGPPQGCRKKDFVTEIRSAHLLRLHPSITSFYGWSLDDKSRVLMVTELCEESLFSRLRDRPLPWRELVFIMLDVAKGLLYMHSRTPPLVHLDIAARNVLLSFSGSAKLADLGLCKQEGSKPECFPVVSSAPELLVEGAVATRSCDVWSFGVFVWESVTRPLNDPYHWLRHDNDLSADFGRRVRASIVAGKRLRLPMLSCDVARFLLIMESCWLPLNERPSMSALFDLHLSPLLQQELPQSPIPPAVGKVIGRMSPASRRSPMSPGKGSTGIGPMSPTSGRSPSPRNAGAEKLLYPYEGMGNPQSVLETSQLGSIPTTGTISAPSMCWTTSAQTTVHHFRSNVGSEGLAGYQTSSFTVTDGEEGSGEEMGVIQASEVVQRKTKEQQRIEELQILTDLRVIQERNAGEAGERVQGKGGVAEFPSGL